MDITQTRQSQELTQQKVIIIDEGVYIHTFNSQSKQVKDYVAHLLKMFLDSEIKREETGNKEDIEVKGNELKRKPIQFSANHNYKGQE